MPWLTVHLVAVAAFAGVGWTVQLLVYPAFTLVGPAAWSGYHARHTRAITRVVALPWAVQGVTTVALLLDPPAGCPATLALAALAALPVAATAAVAVPVHNRLGGSVPDPAVVRTLLRANLTRTWAWTASTALAGWLPAGVVDR